MNGHKIGGITTGLEAAGLLAILGGQFFFNDGEQRNLLVGGGSVLIGAGVVFGFVVPFFHHKPGAQISQNNVPFNLELVSSNNQEVNGFRISYNMRF